MNPNQLTEQLGLFLDVLETGSFSAAFGASIAWTGTRLELSGALKISPLDLTRSLIKA
jgi:hypothetical protein